MAQTPHIQPDLSSPEIVVQRRSEQLDELKKMVQTVTSYLAMPLYMAFWLCDLIYAYDKKWLFLTYRVFTVLCCGFIHKRIIKAKTLVEGERIALSFAFVCSFFIALMAIQTGGPYSPYYAGLNLACVAMLLFFPWSNRYCALAIVAIYGFYFAVNGYLVATSGGIRDLAVNSFFMLSTVIISLVIRHFSEQLRLHEVGSRFALRAEVCNRDQIIKQKTEEGLKLSTLSAQFSPQVVQSIRKGEIALHSGVHRSNICTIMIDVVGSTERVSRIDSANVNHVLGMFLDDSVKILLKYDITVDKFLGDGILAFSNDPIRYTDYTERTLRAALEIKARIKARQSEYEEFWLKPLDLRIGIARGFANVGFYGSLKYFKTYTAVGPVVNLASRLCSSAEPNQVLVTTEVFRPLENSAFQFNLVGKKTLRGFEADIIKVYELLAETGDEDSKSPVGSTDCAKCGGLMYLDSSSGFFAFKCRDCGAELQDPNQKKAA